MANSNYMWDTESNVTTLPEYTSERGSLRSYTSLLIASGDPRYRYSTDALSLGQLPPLPAAAGQNYQPPRQPRPLPSIPLHNQSLTVPSPVLGQEELSGELIQEPVQTPSEEPAEQPIEESIIIEDPIVQVEELTGLNEVETIFTPENISTSLYPPSQESSVMKDSDDPERISLETDPTMPNNGTNDTIVTIEPESNQPSSQLPYRRPYKPRLQKRAVQVGLFSFCPHNTVDLSYLRMKEANVAAA
ncbi:hypothetical protein Clacol_007743 [Clathrus columnatus]|uniref:Uncharacterized protein n=1 Tax=Clathrus columnatus TaxID=1419009 RepID=A0AAV5AK46_9AGAM|nr:hypothetical protein Clacol_007743 [Clathrus columnatus]